MSDSGWEDAVSRLEICPLTIRDANALVAKWHRHHKPVVGALFAVGVAIAGEDDLCGAAIVGRPCARMLQDGFTAEVVRCVTDGTKNACSCLYGSAWRAARALGYRRLVTYTLRSESGASLRASGYRLIAQTKGGSWDRPSRPRVDKFPTEPKLLWEQRADFDVDLRDYAAMQKGGG